MGHSDRGRGVSADTSSDAFEASKSVAAGRVRQQHGRLYVYMWPSMAASSGSLTWWATHIVGCGVAADTSFVFLEGKRVGDWPA